MKSIRATSALLHQLPTPIITRNTLLSKTNPLLLRPQQQQQQQRNFFPNPFAAPAVQSLTASRTLPYSSSILYDIISDVNSYHTFLPFCRESTVTKFSNPDANNKTWPEEGKLVIGFHSDVSETFYSRIYCSPGESVEAVSGAETETTLSKDKIEHHNPRPEVHRDPSRNSTVLTHLLTRWTLRPLDAAAQKTEVNLVIDYAFANPLYAALSAAAAPKVADKMIEAFEKRVRDVVARK